MTRVDDNLWRGPRPKDLRELQAQGFVKVISLQSGFSDRYTDSLLEAQRAQPQSFGITYVTIPCRNWLPPTDSQVRTTMLNIRGAGKTYLHCHSGVDRTGFMCAVYRIQIQGWSFENAYREWKAEGRHWWFFWWKPFLRSWRASGPKRL